MSVRSRRLWNRGFLIAIAIASCAIIVFPYYWMIVTSVQPTARLFDYPPHLGPVDAQWQHYVDIFSHRPVAVWLWNSVRVALATTVAAMALGALGGYALSRFRFRGRGAAGFMILVTQMLPTTLMVIPIYMIFKSISMLDTLSGLALAYTTFALPYCLWMMKGFFDTIPRDIEEAAAVDGCSRLAILFKVVLPLSAPGLVATALFSFILAWDEYLFGITLTRSPATRTMAVGIATFIGEYGTPWDLIMTASAIATIPVLVMFLFLQRYLIQGLTAGAVKG